VLNNRGNTPFSGGIVLARAFEGAPSTGNRVVNNVAFSNAPADVVNNSGGAGTNTFARNRCDRSQPAGFCH
jgi:hypothetical protein